MFTVHTDFQGPLQHIETQLFQHNKLTACKNNLQQLKTEDNTIKITFTAMAETYLILCVDPVTQESALTNPSPHTLTSPLHSLSSPSQDDLFLHVQAAASWRALSTVLTEPGDRWDEAGVKQSTTDAQDERNCNHQMFPTPTESRCCSPDGKEEVGSARSRSCFHSKASLPAAELDAHQHRCDLHGAGPAAALQRASDPRSW